MFIWMASTVHSGPFPIFTNKTERSPLKNRLFDMARPPTQAPTHRTDSGVTGIQGLLSAQGSPLTGQQ